MGSTHVKVMQKMTTPSHSELYATFAQFLRILRRSMELIGVIQRENIKRGGQCANLHGNAHRSVEIVNELSRF